MTLADYIVSNGKALSQSNVAKHMFVTKEGIVVVASDKTPITGWTKANFYDAMKEIFLKLWRNKNEYAKKNYNKYSFRYLGSIDALSLSTR